MGDADYFSARNVGAIQDSSYSLPAYITRRLPDERSAKILDLGCGFGQTLSAVRELGYSQIMGVDINKRAVQHCLHNNILAEHTSIADFLLRCKEKYDFVIMSHVLEHIEKPLIIKTLKLVKDILSQKGSLLVMVPNAQGNTGAYWAYEDFTHSVIFTSGSLIYVGRMAGFSSVELVDIDLTEGASLQARIVRRILMPVYRANVKFWNKVTGSSYHRPSPEVFSYELKALMKP